MDKTEITIDVDGLLGEIKRYLAVVEAFRSLGCNVGQGGRPERSKNER